MDPSPFEQLGGLDGVRALVDRFYDVMDALPEAAGIRAMHPPDLADSREKLWMFLVGRLGGPPIYVERRGHPRLRARHMPFAIGDEESAAWVACMDVALEELVPDLQLRAGLRAFFAETAAHMRNRSQAPAGPAIGFVSAAATRPLRALLRAGQVGGDQGYPGDDGALSFHLGVVVDSRLAGVASFSEEAPPAEPGAGGWWLRGLVIRPELQRRGLGRALVEVGAAEVGRRGGRRLWAEAPGAAVAFFTRLGFEERGGVEAGAAGGDGAVWVSRPAEV